MGSSIETNYICQKEIISVFATAAVTVPTEVENVVVNTKLLDIGNI